jgi:ubiquinol-cytochrome c reductase cytochrome c1 subunit
MRKIFLAAGLAGLVSLGAAGPAPAAEETIALPTQAWSFDGVFGTFDRAAAQRGFQVYHDICAKCHSLDLIAYRNLEELGFSEEQVKAIAAGDQVVDRDDRGMPVTDDSGKIVMRPGRPSDRFAQPDKAITSALPALPPDLSLIARAREDGENYVFALLAKGYETPPAGWDPSANYNKYFPGHRIGMPPPLADNAVTYADGTAATLDQEVRDVVNFLEWTADPNLEERHRTGLKVILFLIAMTLVLYAAKRRIWSDVHKDEH